MRRVVDPFKAKIIEAEAQKAFQPPITPPNGVDLKDLLDDLKVVLHREVASLLSMSTLGALDKDSSDALVKYIKVVQDAIEKEKDMLKDLSDEDLAKLSGDKTE